MNDEERKQWRKNQVYDLIRHDSHSLILYHLYDLFGDYDPREDKTHRCYGCKYLDGNIHDECRWCSRLIPKDKRFNEDDDNYEM